MADSDDRPRLPAPDFAAVFRLARTPMLLLAPDAPRFTILDVNDAYRAATMTTRDGLIGRALFDAFPDDPDDRAATGAGNLAASLERALASGAADAMPTQRYDIRRPDGSFEERHWSPLNTPVQGADGAIAAIIHQVEDVTAEVLGARANATSQKRLQDNEARLRLVQQAGGVGSFDYDIASGRIVRSPEYLAIHGLLEHDTQEGAFTEDWRDRLHPDDRARVIASFEADMANPGPFDLEYRIRRVDTGETRWIVNRGMVVADAEGRAARLISAQTDVTAHKAVEAALAARHRELGNAIEAGGFGTWTIDLATLELVTSDVCRIAYGRDPGTEFSWTELLSSVHPDDRERMESTAAYSASTGTDYDIEYRIVTPAGETRSVYIRAQATLDAAGKPVSMTGISLDVTERRRADDALRASETRFRTLVETVTTLVWQTDGTGNFVEPNAAWERFTGQTTEQTLGFGWVDAIHPDDRVPLDNAYRAALPTRSAYVCEYRLRRADGEYRLMQVNGAPIVDAAGEVVEWIGANTDLTDQRRAEDALRESEARFRAIADSAPVPIWVTNLDRKRGFVNQAYVEFVGVPYEEALVLDWRPRIHLDDIGQHTIASIMGEASMKPFELEARYRRADGEWRWLSSVSRPRFDPDGAHVGFISVAYDVTAAKEAELRLRESEARFRLIADSAPVPIWVTKLDRTRGFVNRAYCDFLGLSYDDCLTFDWRAIIHPDDAEELRAASIAGEASLLPFALEGRYRRGDGEWRWLRSESQPRWDSDGVHIGFIGVAHDITDAKQAEILLRESESRFRNMADHAPVMMWVTAPDGFCTYLNKSWYDFTGQSVAEAEGFGWLDATHPDDKAEAERVFLEANAAHTPFRVEYRLRRADGVYRWAIDAAAPRFGSDGDFAGFIGSVIEIDERREMEDRLRIGEARLRAAVEAVQGVVWTNTPDGEMEGEQAGWGALTGQSPDEYRGFGWSAAVHPDDAQPTLDAWRRAVETRSVFEFEHRVCSADHEWRDYAVRAIPTLDADGAILEWVGVHTDITERKRAELKLRENEAELRLVTDALPVLVSFIDQEFRYRFNNRAYEEWFGRKREEIYGRTMREVLGDAAFAKVEPYARRALGGEHVHFEAMVPYRDAGPRDVEVEYIPHAAPDGRVLGYYAMVQDVSDRKAAALAERKHAAEREAILQQLAEGVIITDARGHITFANTAAATLHGVDAIDTTPGSYSSIFSLYSEDGEPLSFDQLPLTRAFREGEATIGMRWRLLRPDGVELVMLGSAQPVMGPGGGLMGAVLTFSDDTVRAEAEQALERLNETLEDEVLRRTAERDRLWDSSPDLLAVMDFEGIFRRVNPAWTTMLGYAPDEVVGQRFDPFIHPEDTVLTEQALADTTSGGGIAVENRYRAKDGSFRTIAWRTAPAGDIFYCYGRDVTMFNEQRAALVQAEESLRQAQKMEAIGKLTGGIAHDFNNLLTVIMSSADLLKRPDIAPEKRARYVEAIGETAQRAAALTSQLLAFARRQPLTSEAFDAAARVRGLRAMLGTMLGEGVRLAITASAGPLVVKADPNQFESALLNMAVNARDAMPGGGKLSIALAVNADPAFIDVSVADTGQGIAPDKLAAIFEPFYTTKAVGKGTGLGLSQVYGFAQQSGGRIEVTSEPGRGTRFTMTLPRGKRADSPRKADTAPCEMRAARILVVEDNRSVGEFAARLLDDMGHSVALETDGESALRRIETGEPFDLVFSDVIMPGSIDGLALARKLRTDHPALPVILTTGYAQGLAEDAAHGFEILRKPYSAEALAALIAKAVR